VGDAYCMTWRNVSARPYAGDTTASLVSTGAAVAIVAAIGLKGGDKGDSGGGRACQILPATSSKHDEPLYSESSAIP